jgi:hypothetical protein
MKMPAQVLAKLQSEIMALNVKLSHAKSDAKQDLEAILNLLGDIAEKKFEAAQAFALVNA